MNNTTNWTMSPAASTKPTIGSPRRSTAASLGANRLVIIKPSATESQTSANGLIMPSRI
jgi:hypothetical protein